MEKQYCSYGKDQGLIYKILHRILTKSWRTLKTEMAYAKK